MQHLFSEGTIGPITIKNRIVMAPMCLFSADKNGFPNEFHYVHYVQRAMHQVGLIIFEATSVSRKGRISEADLGIWSDEFIMPLKKIVDDCHKYGCKVALQLGHAGRKCDVADETPIGPSAIKIDDLRVPIKMEEEHINKFISDMQKAAIRADEAGFDAIELHAAHGYLINQFLSPITNKRNDKYGGSPENRSRLLREVVKAIGEVFPKDKAIIVRISAEEYHEDGLHPKDLADALNSLGSLPLGAVNVSTGGVIYADIKAFPGYQTRPAETIKELTANKTISGGMVFDPKIANEIIESGKADFVFIGRGLLYDSAWVIKAQKTLNYEQQWPEAYKGALQNLDI